MFGIKNSFMIILTDKIEFPPVSQASIEGILAVGGDLSSERLVHAYKSGIFPWFENEEPILWWSPDPRFVLFPNKLRVSKSMRQIMRKHKFKITVNKNFKTVIHECAKVRRKGQFGTWINHSMIEAYCKLYDLGYAKSVEVWDEDLLVGGLYGIDIGNGIFSGESMFSKQNNASKVGFITFIQKTKYKAIDCQVYTQHLASLGAEDIPREQFIELLN